MTCIPHRHQLFKPDFSAVRSKNTIDLHRQIEGTTKLGQNPAMGQSNKYCHKFTLFYNLTMGAVNTCLTVVHITEKLFLTMRPDAKI